MPLWAALLGLLAIAGTVMVLFAIGAGGVETTEAATPAPAVAIS